jgi:hypothetical protein
MREGSRLIGIEKGCRKKGLDSRVEEDGDDGR